MRPATKEERESINRYIKSIANKTEVTFMTDTYNTSGEPVDYQDRMARKMIQQQIGEGKN